MSKDADITKIAGEKLNSPSRNRDLFLKLWVDLTLDADTAYSKLKLSEDNKTVELTDITQIENENPKRFLYVPQVLCKEVLTGRSYFEIEWVGTKGAGIAISSDDIPRKTAGDECIFGCNSQSWRLQDGVQRNSLYNDVKIPISSHYNIVGVLLDVDTGIIKFYNITPDLEEMTLVAQTSVTIAEKLHAGFWLCEGTNLTISPKRSPKCH